VTSLNVGVFNTGDAELDRMLPQARERIFSPDAELRRDSVEKLWDAWQRLKTLLDARHAKRRRGPAASCSAGRGSFDDSSARKGGLSPISEMHL
jgi:hypothetical protein